MACTCITDGQKIERRQKRKWKKTSMMTGATSVHKSSLENWSWEQKSDVNERRHPWRESRSRSRAWATFNVPKCSHLTDWIVRTSIAAGRFERTGLGRAHHRRRRRCSWICITSAAAILRYRYRRRDRPGGHVNLIGKISGGRAASTIIGDSCVGVGRRAPFN